jgi:hypothetical protein
MFQLQLASYFTKQAGKDLCLNIKATGGWLLGSAVYDICTHRNLDQHTGYQKAQNYFSGFTASYIC